VTWVRVSPNEGHVDDRLTNIGTKRYRNYVIEFKLGKHWSKFMSERGRDGVPGPEHGYPTGRRPHACKAGVAMKQSTANRSGRQKVAARAEIQRQPRAAKTRQQGRAAPKRMVPSPMSRPRTTGGHWRWALALIVGLVFGRTLFQSFSPWDDSVTVYANPYFNPVTFAHLLQFWIHPYDGLYIPLSYTIFGAISAVSHSNAIDLASQSHVSPTLFHLANLGFHVANTILVFVILRSLVKRDLPALLGALLFGMHPLQVESVAWIPELRGLSCALFCLLAIRWYLLYLDAVRDGRGGAATQRPYAATLIAATLAILCKPAAISLPLVLFVLDRWQTGRPLFAGVRTVAPLFAPGIAIYLLTVGAQPVEANLIVPLYQRPFVAGDALAFYLTKLVVPFNLAIVYGRTPNDVLAHWWGYATWLLPTGLAVFAWIRRRDLPWLGVGAAISAAALLPNIGLVPFQFQQYSTVADRYAYLALLGPALVLAFTLAKVRDQMLLWSSGAVLLCFAVLSPVQIGYWDNSMTLWGHAVEVSGSDMAYLNEGVQQRANGMQGAAMSSFRQALSLNPINQDAHIALGSALLNLGRFSEASAEFRKAIALDDSKPTPHFQLGIALLETGHQREGLAELRESIHLTLDPATRAQQQQHLAKLIHDLAAGTPTPAARRIPSPQ